MLDRLDLDTEKPSEEEIAKRFGFEDEYMEGRVTWWQQTKPRIWSMFDEPYSSSAALFALNNLFGKGRMGCSAGVVWGAVPGAVWGAVPGAVWAAVPGAVWGAVPGAV